MVHPRFLVVAAALALSVGCSAKLSHYILVPIVSTHVVTKDVTQSGKDDAGKPVSCTTRVHQFVSLPTGEAYGLNVEHDAMSWFSSNEFSVSFYENGALKQVTLNSDPQVDETLTATAGLVKELGSLAAAAARAPCPTKDVTTTEVVKCVLPFDQWKANDYKCRP
jgi:hypothetical protein